MHDIALLGHPFPRNARVTVCSWQLLKIYANMRAFTAIFLNIARTSIGYNCTTSTMLSTVLFNAILGSQARFKKHGMHLQYNGFYPLLCVYRADFVQVSGANDAFHIQLHHSHVLCSFLGDSNKQGNLNQRSAIQFLP